MLIRGPYGRPSGVASNRSTLDDERIAGGPLRWRFTVFGFGLQPDGYVDKLNVYFAPRQRVFSG